MPPREKKEGYVHVGDMLRDALVEDISAYDWEDRQARAVKIKTALQQAAPHRGGYLVDTNGWSEEDVDFLRMELDSIREDEGHSAMGHGVSFGNTRIGRQIRALREKL